MIVATLGDQGLTQPHMKVVGMLLESAALNIPITVVAAVGVAVAGGGFGSLAMQLVVPCQVSFFFFATFSVLEKTKWTLIFPTEVDRFYPDYISSRERESVRGR